MENDSATPYVTVSAEAPASVSEKPLPADNGVELTTLAVAVTEQVEPAESSNTPLVSANHSEPVPSASSTPPVKKTDDVAIIISNGVKSTPSATFDYNEYLEKVKEKWPKVPDVEIQFKDAGYTVNVPLEQHKIETVPAAITDLLTCAKRRTPTKPLTVLHPLSGVIKPGTITLVLAPPGHGKSTFLKMLSGGVHPTTPNGSITYNGLTQQQCLEQSVYISKLVSYVDQVDLHLPLLTVRETLQFALDNMVLKPARLQDSELAAIHANKVNMILTLLGLHECADTVVGDELVRGISGGQKKRVTIGEFLIGDSRILCLDEVTTGLDSAAALDIFRALHEWVRITNGSIVTALLQPTPELFALFDRVVLLREGCVVFDGPREQMSPYLEGLGYICPADQDECDWVTELLSDPFATFHKQYQREHGVQLSSRLTPSLVHRPLNGNADGDQKAVEEGHDAAQAAASRRVTAAVSLKSMQSKSSLKEDELPPMSTVQLRDRWQNSAEKQKSDARLQTNPLSGFVFDTEYARLQYGRPYAHGTWKHTRMCIKRQATVLKRNTSLNGPKIGQAVFMGLVMGSLYYQLDLTKYSEKIGLMLFACINSAFGNFAEIPISVPSKSVVFKQLQAGFYPSAAYVMSVVLVALPITILETTVFSTLLYWLAGFTQSDNGVHYILWIVILLSVNLCFSALYRALAYVAPNMEVAQVMAGPTTAICVMFGGFLITYEKIPDPLIFLYWISPMSWALRSLAQNEFLTSDYDAMIQRGNETIRLGDAYLQGWEISTDGVFMGFGILVLLSLWLVFIVISIFTLKIRRDGALGTSRLVEDPALQKLTTVSQLNSYFDKLMMLGVPRAAASASSASLATNTQRVGSTVKAVVSALPFKPLTLTFKDISYYVQVPTSAEQRADGHNEKTVEKRLLVNVSGYARPGTLTALMGSSGAGKTTLMDVVAGRKTGGRITGEILVNGFKTDKTSFSRVIGYVEQMDLHIATLTVKESLTFSGRLRLPSSVTSETLDEFVQEVLDILELSELADRLIGNEVIPGLSPGQLKRVTIGVETVANPSILFLDEPTSGLDSRAALTVMRVVKKLSTTGRSVVCTIHQPSAELFYMFDRLLLLATGGRETYFGDVGVMGDELVRYFEDIPGTQMCPVRMNPASWMLDVIGAGTGISASSQAAKLMDYPDFFSKSSLKQRNAIELERLRQPKDGATPVKFTSLFAATWWTQFVRVLGRYFTSYWRNVDFNATRMMVSFFLSILFGLVYFQIDATDLPGLNSKIAVMFMTCSFCGVIHAGTAGPVVARERAVYYRERASNTYASLSYSTSLGIVELPWIGVGSLIFVLPYYFLVGLDNNAGLFFRYVFAHFGVSLAFSYLGQFMATALPNIQVAQIVQSVFFTFFFLFGGVFIQAPNIPVGWKWMYIINPVPKGLKALCMPQFECEGPQCPAITVLTPTGPYITTTQAFVSEYLDADTGVTAYWMQMLYAFIIILVFRVLVSFSLQYINHLKR